MILQLERCCFKESCCKNMTKISIRFFNEREVRAFGDKEHFKWFFAEKLL